jgi:hypothetical protein
MSKSPFPRFLVTLTLSVLGLGLGLPSAAQTYSKQQLAQQHRLTCSPQNLRLMPGLAFQCQQWRTLIDAMEGDDAETEGAATQGAESLAEMNSVEALYQRRCVRGTPRTAKDAHDCRVVARQLGHITPLSDRGQGSATAVSPSGAACVSCQHGFKHGNQDGLYCQNVCSASMEVEIVNEVGDVSTPTLRANASEWLAFRKGGRWSWRAYPSR